MPELPEVETVIRGLQPALEGKTISQAAVYRRGLRLPFPENFAAALSGNRVCRLTRRSKYILVEMADGLVMIIHLGMSGRVSIFRPTDAVPPRAPHDHMELFMADGARIRYTDPRRFGLIIFSTTDDVANHRLLKDIGPEPLSNSFNEAALTTGLTGRKSSIKAALLDQKLVAGLGNIYVCEALFRARISPLRSAHMVAGEPAYRLVPIIRQVLTDAIVAGGSSLKDFAQTNGDLGYFQHRFQVYGREGEACPDEGCNAEIVRISQAGRSTFYCPQCQK